MRRSFLISFFSLITLFLILTGCRSSEKDIPDIEDAVRENIKAQGAPREGSRELHSASIEDIKILRIEGKITVQIGTTDYPDGIPAELKSKLKPARKTKGWIVIVKLKGNYDKDGTSFDGEFKYIGYKDEEGKWIAKWSRIPTID